MISRKVQLFFAGMLGAVLLAVPFVVQAQGLMNDINKQNQAFAGQNGADLKNSDPRIVVAQGIKITMSILGTLLTAWTVYGGFLILTSAGDSEKMDKGKSVVTNGVIGLIIILMSYSIATFVYKLWSQPTTKPATDPTPQVDTNFYKDPNAGDSQAS